MLRRLDVRIPLSLSLILTALVAVFGWQLSRRQGEAQLQSVIGTAEVLAEAHANDAGHFLLISEYAGLEQHLLECMRIPGIQTLQVLEPDGRAICSVTRQTGTGTGLVLAPPHDKGWVPSGRRQVIERDRDRMVLWTPIVAGDVLGWLRTEYSLDSVREMRTALWWSTGILGALLVLAGILMMIWTLRPPSGPSGAWPTSPGT